MALGSDRFEIEDSDPEPDLSPMIDCVFILLIFFIVTATFVAEEGFQVNRPEDSSAAQTASEDETLLLLLTAANQVVYKGRTVPVESIQGIVRGQLQFNDESPIIIQSNPQARHGLTMEVHNECLAGGAAPVKITHTID